MDKKMDKNQAMQALADIYTALSTIPVFDEQCTNLKAGIFRALNEVAKWVDGLPCVDDEAGDDST
jgi:hypothetical protein